MFRSLLSNMTKPAIKLFVKMMSRKFLKDELADNQIEMESLTRVHLKNLDLKPELLNCILSQHRINFVVKKLFVAHVIIQLPAFQAGEELKARSIEVTRLEVSVIPVNPADFITPEQVAEMDLKSSIARDVNDTFRDLQRQVSEISGDNTRGMGTDPTDSIRTIAEVLQKLLYDLEFRVNDLVIGISHSIGEDREAERIHAMLVIPYMDLADVSSQKDSDAPDPSAPIRKVFTFSGMHMKLMEDRAPAPPQMTASVFPLFDDETYERAERDFLTTTILQADDPTYLNRIFFQLENPKQSMTDTKSTSTFARIELGHYRIVLSPKHTRILMELFGEKIVKDMAEDFAAEQSVYESQEAPSYEPDSELMNSITKKDVDALCSLQHDMAAMMHSGQFHDFDDGGEPPAEGQFFDFDDSDEDETEVVAGEDYAEDDEPTGGTPKSLPRESGNLKQWLNSESFVSAAETSSSEREQWVMGIGNVVSDLTQSNIALRDRISEIGVQSVVKVDFKGISIALAYDSYTDDACNMMLASTDATNVTQTSMDNEEWHAEVPQVQADHIALSFRDLSVSMVRSRLDCAVKGSLDAVRINEFLYNGPTAGTHISPAEEDGTRIQQKVIYNGLEFLRSPILEINERKREEPDIQFSASWIAKDQDGVFLDTTLTTNIGSVHVQVELDILERLQQYFALSPLFSNLYGSSENAAGPDTSIDGQEMTEELMPTQQVTLTAESVIVVVCAPAMTSLHSRQEKRIQEYPAIMRLSFDCALFSSLQFGPIPQRKEISFKRFAVSFVDGEEERPPFLETIASNAFENGMSIGISVRPDDAIESIVSMSSCGNDDETVDSTATTVYCTKTNMSAPSEDPRPAINIQEDYLEETMQHIPEPTHESVSTAQKDLNEVAEFCFTANQNAVMHFDVIITHLKLSLSRDQYNKIMYTVDCFERFKIISRSVPVMMVDACPVPLTAVHDSFTELESVESNSSSVFTNLQSMTPPRYGTESIEDTLPSIAEPLMCFSVSIHIPTLSGAMYDELYRYDVDLKGGHIHYTNNYSHSNNQKGYLLASDLTLTERNLTLNTKTELVHKYIHANSDDYTLFVKFEEQSTIDQSFSARLRGVMLYYSPGYTWLSNISSFFKADPISMEASLSADRYRFSSQNVVATPAVVAVPKTTLIDMQVHEFVVSYKPLHESGCMLITLDCLTATTSASDQAKGPMSIECVLSNISTFVCHRTLSGELLKPFPSLVAIQDYMKNLGLVKLVSAKNLRVQVATAYEDENGKSSPLEIRLANGKVEAGLCLDSLRVLTLLLNDLANTPSASSFEKADRMLNKKHTEKAVDDVMKVDVERASRPSAVADDNGSLGADGASDDGIVLQLEDTVSERPYKKGDGSENSIDVVEVVDVSFPKNTSQERVKIQLVDEGEAVDEDAPHFIRHDPVAWDASLEDLMESFTDFEDLSVAVTALPRVRWFDEDARGWQLDEDYLSNVTKESNVHRFHRLPDVYPRSHTRIIISNFSVKVNLFVGNDFPIGKLEGGQRDTQNHLLIHISPINASFDQFVNIGDVVEESLEEHFDRFRWRLALGLGNIEIQDKLMSSTWQRFLCYDWHYLRRADKCMLELELVNVNRRHALPPQQYLMKLNLLPMRLHIDEDALNILLLFGKVEAPMREEEEEAPIESESSSSFFFEQVEVGQYLINIDYKARTIGDLSLEHAKFNLPPITLANLNGFDALGKGIKQAWFPSYKLDHVTGYLSGLKAVRPIAELASGMADLVLLPMEQYQRNGRVFRGMRDGVYSLFSKITTQTLDVAARLSSGTTTLLDNADEILGGVPTEDHQAISRYARQPQNLKDGTRIAVDTLSERVSDAYATIADVPAALERDGASQALRTAIQRVPHTILRPTSGLFGGLAEMLKGVRNQIDPANKMDAHMKYVTSGPPM